MLKPKVFETVEQLQMPQVKEQILGHVPAAAGIRAKMQLEKKPTGLGAKNFFCVCFGNYNSSVALNSRSHPVPAS